MEFEYGDKLTEETLKMQEESPEDFKEFMQTGKLLETIVAGKSSKED